MNTKTIYVAIKVPVEFDCETIRDVELNNYNQYKFKTTEITILDSMPETQVAKPATKVKSNPFCADGMSDELDRYLPVGTELFMQHTSAVAAQNVSDEQIQAVWNEACKDTPSNPGWNRHIRFARLLLATPPEAKGVPVVECTVCYDSGFDPDCSDYKCPKCGGIKPERGGNK